jgi:hypothetical protein
MTASAAARRTVRPVRFAGALAVLALLLVITLAAPRSAHAAGSTTCEPSAHGQCWTSSRNYPKQTGWYGIVGALGNCGWTPFAGFSREGTSVVCIRSAHETAYQWTNGSWRRTELAAGVRGYIAPYAGTWRWLYVDGQGWFALGSDHVGIIWTR